MPAVRLCAIHRHHHAVNVLRRRMGESTLRYRWRAERYPGRAPWLVIYWTRRHRSSARAWRAYRSAPWLHGSWHTAALCVHHYEGAWTADTGNGYYGGMQFDLTTWASNGGRGRPDLATPAEQLHIAYRTWQHRGWAPWPSTAHTCGLI